MIVPVGIALGSNLGDRSAELDEGIAFLRRLGGLCSLRRHDGLGEIRESPRIETAPVDCPPGSAPFLNSVAEIELDSVILPPLQLLAELQEFEIKRGRSPIHDRNSPRPLDLDIIYYGIEHFDQMGLIIPHTRAHLRRFVLEPLSYLRPDLILPGQTETVTELLAKLSS